jgi:serine/threonine protein kinase
MINSVNQMHKKGIIHRDLKPSNFLMNDKMEVVITDFGISK